MSEPVTARGTSGTIVFDGVSVTIHRTGISRLTIGKGHKQIPLDHITAVQFKPAGPLVNGFIQFTLAGGIEPRSRAGSQTFDAVRDENSVVFTRKQMPDFELIRGLIQGAHAARLGGQPAASGVQARMEELKAMLDGGLITTGEYDLKRIDLLSQL